MAATKNQRDRFFTLLDQGLSKRKAAAAVGVSEATGYRWAAGYEKHVEQLTEETRHLRDPLPFEELSPLGQELLRDFGLFSEKILCRVVTPWRVKAAELSVEFLMDQTEKTFVVANMPPGVGKTTLWTMDIPLWLCAGGGILDPARGRSLRFMLGHEGMSTAQSYLRELQYVFSSPRPYYDFDQKREAEVVMAEIFGRFRPDPGQGDYSGKWSESEFIVAQAEGHTLYKKESTFQAASYEKGFLGQRVDYAAWDDLVTPKNSFSLEKVEAMARWMDTQTERRVEPGGVFWLIGQRIGPNDLFRERLNKLWEDEEGEVHQLYHHIVFPAHHEATCDGAKHHQWDAEENGKGCLLDEARLPWREILQVRPNPDFRTVFQQEDSDPTQVLVPQIYLDGGLDVFNEELPGCWDRNRGFFEFPEGVGGLVNYATVDVASGGRGGGWWAIEWWAVKELALPRYLIYGTRRKMGAGDLLDWRHAKQQFGGLMEELQTKSIELGQPIRVWVIESNGMQKHLLQYDHYHRWLEKWKRYVVVIPHETQRNKTDPKLGLESLLPPLYRDGNKRLPRKPGDLDALTYTKQKQRELTTYQIGSGASGTTDTVMADWEGEYRLQTGDILSLGRRPTKERVWPGPKLPPYLERQRREYPV